MGETPQRSAVWILLGGLVGFAALVLWSLYHFVLGPGLMSNVVRQRQAAHLGEYPRSLEALGGTAAREPDPWGHPWSYAPPGRGELRPTLRSLGRDGLPGGTGEDADVDREGVLRAAR